MSLSLFTVFHANLEFSAVPPGDAGRVLDRCLWPLVEATRRPGVRLGLEMAADTLARIGAEDAFLLEAIRAAIAEGRLEPVGSGLVQAVLPLVPAAVVEQNLRRGREVYAEWLGRIPAVAYLHEQTYAAGLVPLYRDAGYEAIVAEWENPASAHAWPERLRYRAAWVEGTAGARIACLWNSSVTFQRVQRYARGEVDLDEVLGHLLGHHAPDEARLLCLYGNDCEVFDYRPGEGGLAFGGESRGEWARLERLLAALAADPRATLVLPSEALARHPPAGTPLRLETAAVPVPAKKQAKYNVTRWAVCGRENPRLNARCHALQRRLEVAASLHRAGAGTAAVPEPGLARAADEIVRLWGSDLRTHTTEERLEAAAVRLGALADRLDAVVGRLGEGVLGTPLAPDELALFNPDPATWAGWPVAVRLRFPPGRVRGGVGLVAAGREVPAQAEEIETYRDGSWRRALVVAAPVVPPLSALRLRWVAAGARPDGCDGTAEAAERIDTASASVRLAPRRGATIRSLAFPRLVPGPIAGTVPLGSFAPIELAADWYTGGLVLYDAAGTKHTDLEPTTLRLLAPPEACPIRIPVAARLAGAYGVLWKTIHVYRDLARVDVGYHFVLRDQRPRSLRLGVLTLEPGAFEPRRLAYATVNGGRDVERFPLDGTRVALHEAVSPAVSARGCLGATEGWIDVGDDAKGITLAWDPARLAAAPLVQHEPAGERALTRVFLSLAESDDTAAPFWRGHAAFTVSYLGRGSDPVEARRRARATARGLHVLRPRESAHG
jgi:hypothetical protein